MKTYKQLNKIELELWESANLLIDNGLIHESEEEEIKTKILKGNYFNPMGVD